MSSDAHLQSDGHVTKPKPGSAALRRHRWSAGSAEYFVTVSVQRPAAKLAEASLVNAVRRQIERLEAERAWRVRTGVVMPDHLHLLFSLGESDALSECLRFFKGRVSPALRSHQLRWQDGYYVHRLRPSEDRLPVFLYIFLNPYRARLIAANQRYPAYFCCEQDWAWFEPLTHSSVPFPAWLA